MNPTRIAVCGYGSRSRLFQNIYIGEQLALLWRGLPVDKTPRTHDFFEVQTLAEGPGTAFQFGSDAALNTGIEHSTKSINKEGLTEEQCKIIDGLTDTASHYARIAMEDPERMMCDLLKNNISTAILFNNATKNGGGLNVDIPCGPREIAGRAMEAMTQDALRLAREYLPWLSINVRYSVVVSDIDLSDPARPVLTVENVETGEKETGLVYDLVIKCSGTTFEVPVGGKIEEHGFTGIPSSSQTTEYLQRQGMLDSEGYIIPGKSTLIGGIGLSAFDFVGLILARTKIVKFNPETKEFTIDKEEAARHRNLVTLFSRTEGFFGACRHVHDAVKYLGSELITPEMILSLTLQRDLETYPTFIELARILTAASCTKRRQPSQIEDSMTTIEHMDRMAAENEVLDKDPKALTETGLFRKWIWSFIFTHTMGPQPLEQRAALVEKYNHIVRHGWHNWRSMSYDISQKPKSEENAAAHERHLYHRRLALNYIAGAPVEIHILITRLYRLGVISWVQGAYEDLTWSEEAKQFNLHGRRADGLIAPRRLTAQSDKLGLKILEQARTSAGEPVWNKGRLLKNTNGEYIHVFELGFTGHGTRWFDTNANEGAYQLMPIITNMAMIIESMISKGIEKPLNELLELHDAVLPKDEEFNEQANQLKEPHRNLTHLILYARLIEKVYGKRFAERMRQGKTFEAREKVISLIADIPKPAVQKALMEFERDWRGYKYDPIDAQKFEEMTPDFSPEHMQAVKKLWSGMVSRKPSDSYVWTKTVARVDVNVSEVTEIELDAFETPRSNATSLVGYGLDSVVSYTQDLEQKRLPLVL
ncbi:hypothetical protein TWF481_009492 [Arthrobotrys musiformis]|uniref:Uncharacterized protein n=1 Tax=Arthrobotrys musiformis TaxID=47236 RepID=A0AAV9W3V5_9PEZI